MKVYSSFPEREGKHEEKELPRQKGAFRGKREKAKLHKHKLQPSGPVKVTIITFRTLHFFSDKELINSFFKKKMKERK